MAGREFWFNFRMGPDESVSQNTVVNCCRTINTDFHVIEYSAYDSIKAQLAEREKKIERVKKALDLTLYYVEGDATYEALKEKVDKILKELGL